VTAIMALAVWAGAAAAQGVGTWDTYRANSARTANSDGLAGPKEPKVLWVVKSKDHFIASPVPSSNHLYLSGLGAFNVASFVCLDRSEKPKERTLWVKTTPYLKLPVVSSPASTGRGEIVFGDGMHQTDGATLHCCAGDGTPLWQYPVPGKLIHLEGSPTLTSDGRCYIGGGSAGVLCVEYNKATLDGKEYTLEQLAKLQKDRWKALQAAYEKEKLTNEFAVPPNEDQLFKPEPKQLWRQGENKWHVDAPVLVAGDKVLVASAFLTLEKLGDRALFCLDAKTGEVKWRVPLEQNPWGGPTLADGDVAIVGCSSIGYDTKLLKGAKGEIVAVNLKDGSVKWRKPVKGGIVSCVAVADKVAIATATDGKVRAYNLEDGSTRWIYDGKHPFFAPPATDGRTAYVGDLGGVIHAIDLKTGNAVWTLDLGTDPAVMAPGMVYGGPIVQTGRVYVATCNLEGPNAQQPTAIVCIGQK
jgi:outer membrane protein assembly factor BamB